MVQRCQTPASCEQQLSNAPPLRSLRAAETSSLLPAEAVTSVGGNAKTEVEVAALTCLKSWLTLSASEAADLLILPGSLQTTQVGPLLVVPSYLVDMFHGIW